MLQISSDEVLCVDPRKQHSALRQVNPSFSLIGDQGPHHGSESRYVAFRLLSSQVPDATAHNSHWHVVSLPGQLSVVDFKAPVVCTVSHSEGSKSTTAQKYFCRMIRPPGPCNHNPSRSADHPRVSNSPLVHCPVLGASQGFQNPYPNIITQNRRLPQASAKPEFQQLDQHTVASSTARRRERAVAVAFICHDNPRGRACPCIDFSK
jgi:hypothetical protein